MEVMDNLVAEFFIRHQVNPRVSPSKFLSALNLVDSPDSVTLKVSAVLRDISNSLIRGTLDERTLDLLEILEKLLLQQHSILTDSHKSAYCWTAVECTLRFMWPLSASDGLFDDARERIWTERIGNLLESGSDLVTDELLNWETDMRNALEDPQLYQRIKETNVRFIAASFLNQLLKEQWALLGSSSLESAAQKWFRKHKAQNVEADVVDNTGNPNAVDENMRSSESDTDAIDKTTNEQRGEKENKNGNSREIVNDVEGVGCLENDMTEKVNDAADEDKQTMGAQEEEHQPSLNEGDKTVARELKDFLLEIQAQIDPSTSLGEEPNNVINQSVDVTPPPAEVNKTGTGDQGHNETPQQNNVNEKGSDSQGTWSGRVRPRLSTPLPLSGSPLKKENSHARRQKKFWTPEEVEALKQGVKEYGKSWKDIKNANPAVFEERTEVDLKDKWRNLFR